MQKGTTQLIIILVSLITSFSARADWQEDVLRVMKKQDYQALLEYTGNSEESSSLESLFRKSITTNLPGGYKIKELRFAPRDIDSTSQIDVMCNLVVVTKNNLIVHGSIFLTDDIFPITQGKSFQDTTEAQLFQEVFCSVYSWPFDIKLYSLSIGEVYGYRCGLTGIDPDLRKAHNILLQKRDTNTLKQWLSSGAPVLQAYAIEGLLSIDNRIPLDSETQNIIDLLVASNQSVPTCSGCIFMSLKFNQINFP